MKVAISFVSLIEAVRVGWDLVCFVCVYVCGRMEMGGNCFTDTFRKICLQGANLPIYFQRISSVKELFKGKGGGFPGGAAVENPPASAGDTGSSPGLGRSHMPRSN